MFCYPKTIVLLFTLFNRLSRVKCNPTCSKLSLQEGSDYCDVPPKNVSCYIQKALDYRQEQSSYLPLWVELCFFELPAAFSANSNAYMCDIALDAGPLKCKVKDGRSPVGIPSSFERNCTIILLWHDHVHFPSAEKISNLVFEKCAGKFEIFWESTDRMYMADRYLATNDIPFSNTTSWMEISNRTNSPWNGFTVALMVIGSIGIFCGLVFCYVKVKQKWKYIRSINVAVESDIVIKHLDNVIFYPDDVSVTMTKSADENL